MPRQSGNLLVSVPLLLCLPFLAVRGESSAVANGGVEPGIWNWTHVASGSASANVFDGGPTVFNDGATTDASDGSMVFGAHDNTMPGSFGAGASASGRSKILDSTDTLFRFSMDFDITYRPSPFPGGDNPGGEAEGELNSVIEFLMPEDVINWGYQLSIDQDDPFMGSTNVLVENVTQSEVLASITSEVQPAILTEIQGATGDLIRITSDFSGSGATPPGGLRQYDSTLFMTFSIPEPNTLLLLLPAFLVRSKKHRAYAQH
jgi:hypothetical protein